MRLEDATELQKDFDALWNWTQESLLNFNLSKCHQLTLTRRPNDQRARGSKPLTSVECKKELGVSVGSRFSLWQ